VLGADFGEVVEHGGLDGLEQALYLHLRLLVAAGGPGGGPVVARPQVDAGQVRVGRQEVRPGVAVAVPVGGEERLQGGGLGQAAALRPVELHELARVSERCWRKRASAWPTTSSGGPANRGVIFGAVAQRLGDGAGLLERRQDLLGGVHLPLLGEGSRSACDLPRVAGALALKSPSAAWSSGHSWAALSASSAPTAAR
jgi:hypothetical protein